MPKAKAIVPVDDQLRSLLNEFISNQIASLLSGPIMPTAGKRKASPRAAKAGGRSRGSAHGAAIKAGIARAKKAAKGKTKPRKRASR